MGDGDSLLGGRCVLWDGGGEVKVDGGCVEGEAGGGGIVLRGLMAEVVVGVGLNGHVP